MAQDQKPREFWIDCARKTDDYFECFVSIKDPQTLSEDDDFMNIKAKSPIHVIEYSAYEKLMELHKKMSSLWIEEVDRLCTGLDRNQKLREALEKLAPPVHRLGCGENPPGSLGVFCELCEIEEALAADDEGKG